MRHLTNPKILGWVLVWILTRAYMLVQIGLWDNVNGTEYEDVKSYEAWSNTIAGEHALPDEETWQYPPGAAFLFLIPRLGPLDFKLSFVILMLVFDLVGFLLVMALADRGRRDAGVWVWLLGMPVLGAMPLLRFDIVPTVIAVAALFVIHRRPGWFGALAGLGAAIKVWPVLLLFAEWDRRRLLRAAVSAGAVVAAVFLVAVVALGDQSGFFTNQGDRGLQTEAVAASPWQLEKAITGEELPVAQQFGTNEIVGPTGDAVSTFLSVAAVLALLAAAWWWRERSRAIDRGHAELSSVDLSRDFAFTIVLLFLVTSRVLSPQFMVWMVGLAAVVLCTRATRLERPAWTVVAAALLTFGLADSPARDVLRNLTLLVAAFDASVTMIGAVRTGSAARAAPGAGDGPPAEAKAAA